MFKDVDENTLTAEDLVLLEMSRMERNTWAVSNEVSLHIDGSPGPHYNINDMCFSRKKHNCNSFMIKYLWITTLGAIQTEEKHHSWSFLLFKA